MSAPKNPDNDPAMVPRLPKIATLPVGILLLIAAGLVFLYATGRDHEDFVNEHGHGHHHVAPHGGTLIVLGMHKAHIELVLDADTGTLDLYALDAHAENAYTLPAEPIEIAVRTTESDPWETVALAPVTDDAATNQRATQFAAVSQTLIGIDRFELRLPPLQIAGTQYEGLTTRYPEGNE